MIPSQFILMRVGAPRWLSCIVTFWGLTAMMFSAMTNRWAIVGRLRHVVCNPAGLNAKLLCTHVLVLPHPRQSLTATRFCRHVWQTIAQTKSMLLHLQEDYHMTPWHTMRLKACCVCCVCRVQFCILRICLGIFESGAFPGMW